MSIDALEPELLAPPALVLENARIAGRQMVGSIVISDGTVIRVPGEEPDTLPEGSVRVDLDGRVVIPGLWDAHVHVEQWAAARRRLDLTGIGSAEEAATAVAAATPPGESGSGDLLVGYGFRDGLWPDRPDKRLLEAVAPGRPVVLQSSDLHTAWLSPAALELVGVPEHPTGILLETDCYRAMRALPEATDEQVDEWVMDAMAVAASRGVTGLIDFEIGDSLVAWQRRASGRRLDVRITCTVYREDLETALARGYRSGEIVPGTGGMVEVGPVKLFVDGSLNSRTALCYHPYPDDGAGGLGRLETDPDDLAAVMTLAAEHGLRSAVHAIGDRATGIALDAFEKVGYPGRIEHAQLVAPQDLQRFSMPGLIVGVQPAHAPDDRDVADRHWPGRTAHAFPFAQLLAAGAVLEIGSDAPVAPLDPWDGISAAVTRTDDDRPPWHPEQRIDATAALRAAARGRERLAPGDPADLAVLEHDPLQVDPALLADPGVVGTLVAGRWTHWSLG